MILSTLCYIRKDDKYLMLHRNKKKNDINKDKWIGIGGRFEENESPEECITRETFEETGLMLNAPVIRAVITFTQENSESEQMFLFTCDDFSGEIKEECNEGDLEWIKIKDVYKTDLWEGDVIFLNKIEHDCDFFTLKLVYSKDGKLLEAIKSVKTNII